MADQRKLETFQNLALRRILGVRPDPVTFSQIPNDVRLEIAGLPSVRDFVKTLTLRLHAQIKDHFNPVVRELANTPLNAIDMRRLRSPFQIISNKLLANGYSRFSL